MPPRPDPDVRHKTTKQQRLRTASERASQSGWTAPLPFTVSVCMFDLGFGLSDLRALAAVVLDVAAMMYGLSGSLAIRSLVLYLRGSRG